MRRSGLDKLLVGSTVFAIVLFLSAYVPPAFSDNLNKNTNSVTFAAGPAINTALKVKIVSNSAQAGSGDPQDGCNAADGTPAVVTFSSTPAGLNVVNSPLSISRCNTLVNVQLQSNVAGTYTITATVSDSNTVPPIGVYHLEPFGSVTVIVTDLTPPVISAHDDVTVNTDPGLATAVVNYDVPTATDNADPSVTVTCTPASGSTFNAGETTVTCTAADSSGNAATPVTFKVIVSDNELPVFSGVPEDIIQSLEPGASSAVVTYTPPTANDNVDGDVTVTCTPASGSSFNAGETTVTCTATDTSNNEATASFKVLLLNIAITLIDPPTAVWGSLVTVSGTENGALPDYTVEVAWGDGSANSSGISITGNSWEATHSYSTPSQPDGYAITAYLKDGDAVKATSASSTVYITVRNTILQFSVPLTVTGETKFVAGGKLVDDFTREGLDGKNIQFTGDGALGDVTTQGVGFIGDITLESCSVTGLECTDDDIGTDDVPSDNMVLHLKEGGKITFPESASTVIVYLQDMGATSFTYTVIEYPDTTQDCEGLPGVQECSGQSFAYPEGGQIIAPSGSEVIALVNVYNGIKEIIINTVDGGTDADTIGIAAIQTRNEDSNPQALHQINFEDLAAGPRTSGFTADAGSYFAYGVAQFDPPSGLELQAEFAGDSLYSGSQNSTTYNVAANFQSFLGVGGTEGVTGTGTSTTKRTCSGSCDYDKDGLVDSDEAQGFIDDSTVGTGTWPYPAGELPSPGKVDLTGKPDFYYEVDCMFGVRCPTQTELNLMEKAWDDPSSTKDINAHLMLSDTGICGTTIVNPVHVWQDSDTNVCNDFKSIKLDWYGTATERVGGDLGAGNPKLKLKSQAVGYILIGYNINTGTTTACGTTGVGEYLGRDVMIATECIFKTYDSAHLLEALWATLLHETGHNMGLGHGGTLASGARDDINCKPNYISVMSYLRQIPTTAMTVQASNTATNVNWYAGFSHGPLRVDTTTGLDYLDENILVDGKKLVMTGSNWKNRDGVTTITSFKLIWGDPDDPNSSLWVKPGVAVSTGQVIDWDGVSGTRYVDLNYMNVKVGTKQLPACTQSRGTGPPGTDTDLHLVSPPDDLKAMRDHMGDFQKSTGYALGLSDFDQDPDLIPEANNDVVIGLNSLGRFSWAGVDSPLTNIPFGESGYSSHKKGNTIPVKYDLFDVDGNEVTGVNWLSVYQIQRMDTKIALVTPGTPPEDGAYAPAQTSTQPGSADFFTWDGSKWAFQMGTKNLSVGGTYAARIYVHFDDDAVIVLDSNGDGISYLFKIVK